MRTETCDECGDTIDREWRVQTVCLCDAPMIPIPTAHDDHSRTVSIMIPDDHTHHDHQHPVDDQLGHLPHDHHGVDHGQAMIDIRPDRPRYP